MYTKLVERLRLQICLARLKTHFSPLVRLQSRPQNSLYATPQETKELEFPWWGLWGRLHHEARPYHDQDEWCPNPKQARNINQYNWIPTSNNRLSTSWSGPSPKPPMIKLLKKFFVGRRSTTLNQHCFLHLCLLESSRILCTSWTGW
jgi:hypothetical protein